MLLVPDVSITSHTCRLLFPFYHCFDDLSKVDNVEGWQDWLERLNKSERERAEDSTFYFQPFVRQILFPGLDRHQPLMSALQITRHLTRMSNGQPFRSVFTLQLLDKDGHPDGEAFLGNILWVDMYLFPDGIGIVVLAVQLEMSNITLNKLAEFLYGIRIVLKPYIGFNLPIINLKALPSGSSISSMQNLIDTLLKPFIDIKKLGGNKGDTYTTTHIGEEEGERCYAFTYARLESAGKGKTSFEGLLQRDIYMAI